MVYAPPTPQLLRNLAGKWRFRVYFEPVIEKERLHKFIARCGVCSRRAAEELIREGRVKVNGRDVTEMGVSVTAEDTVTVDETPIRPEKLVTLVLNKPKGIVTTLRDPQRRPTIMRYLPEMGAALKPVGRLDMETSGLLICSNDGELAMRLSHPSHGIEKEYRVVVRGEVTPKGLLQLRTGVYIEGVKTHKAFVEIENYERRRDSTLLKMVIHEGRNRQIRLMCQAIGNPVTDLERVRIGPLYVKGMRAGECRVLGQQEIEKLRALVGLD